MRRLALALAVLLPVAALAASSPEDFQQVMDDRQALMKGMRTALGGFVPMLKGDKPWQPAEVRRLADRLRADAARMPGLFPVGTSSEQRFTMALPEIWKDAAGFGAAAKATEAAATRLTELAPGRDPAALSAQVEVLTNTCLDCHKAYRLNR
jgi:cytochrome c556